MYFGSSTQQAKISVIDKTSNSKSRIGYLVHMNNKNELAIMDFGALEHVCAALLSLQSG